MTYPPRRRHYADKVDPAQTLAGMRALAATPEAVRRVEALAERWGVGGAPRSADEQRTAEARAELSSRSKRAGQAAESRAAGVLREQGWTVQRSQDSQGAADLIARKAGCSTRWVQIKYLTGFASWALNDAVARFLGLNRWAIKGAQGVGPGETRESWLLLPRAGLAVMAVLDHRGRLTVVGKEPFRTKVEGSLRALIARGRAGDGVSTGAARAPRVSKKRTTTR